MKNKKIKLRELQVKSFATSMKNHEKLTINGGRQVTYRNPQDCLDT